MAKIPYTYTGGKASLTDRLKGMSVIQMIIADILLAGIALCIFAMFHHVIPAIESAQQARRMKHEAMLSDIRSIADAPVSTAVPAIEETAAPEPAQTAQPAQPEAEITAAPDAENAADAPISAESEKTEPEDTEPEEAEPEVWKFEHLMSEPAFKTSSTYSSSDIHVRITHVSSEESIVGSAYTLADIYVRDVRSIQTYSPGGVFVANAPRDSVLDMSKETNAIVATNGDYYSVQYGSGVVRNGQLIRYPEVNMDVCALYRDGRMVTHRMEALRTKEQIDAALENAWQLWSFGPALLDENAEPYSDLDSRLLNYVAGSHPRTGIGYYEPGHYCLLVVDGRQAGTPGTDVLGMAKLFRSFGCTSAYNLDGGGSSCMTFDGELESHPSEMRSLSDIILVCEYEGSVAQRMEESADE